MLHNILNGPKRGRYWKDNQQENSMASTFDNIYGDANNTPPLTQAIPLGLQYVFAMFVSNVTRSIILAGAAGLALS
tara:strand:+ start:1200 stop:1427 length:228 start_codon:yes stop_codon:yes gene_type:complete